jgi:TrmH family RNA methyltransferase
MIITSRSNPKIKKAISLYDRKDRDQEGCFLIEGYRELKRALEGQVQIEQLFYCPSFFLKDNEHTLIAQSKKAGAECIECNSSAFEKLSYRDRPDGLVAVARPKQWAWQDFFVRAAGQPLFILIVQGIEKPGNLGMILRSADGAGVHGVIVCDRCTDLYNPNVVRSSIGTLFSLPVKESSTTETLQWLHENGVNIIAASPRGSIDFTESDFRESLAIVVGAEQVGLSDQWLDVASTQVRIPMLGSADSLNVGAATTLLLYQVVQQRILMT